MKPTLKNQPNSYAYKDLLVNFADGKPISPELANFLLRHEKALSGHLLDPALKYYLKPYHKMHEETHSFLMPTEKLTRENLALLKKRLDIMLQARGAHAQFHMTPEQFTLLKQAGYPELILYHGNQFLTGAPFIPGGIAPILFFQWGNLFGVAKYVIMAEERTLKSNVLIYFEDMQERYLEKCVNDYVQIHQLELKDEQQQLLNQLKAPEEQHQQSMYQIPKLTLSINTGHKEEEK